MAEDNRIKIRELPASDVSGSDTIAVAKNNIEKTIQASLTDAVRAGLTIEAGSGITVTQTATGVKISGTAEFDDSDIQTKLTDLQAQINALKNADTGASVKAQPTPPTSSSNGDLWWDSNTASMYIKYNSAWVQTNGGGGGGTAEIADGETPGIVAPDSNFKIGHSGYMTLNSYVTIPAIDISDSSGNNTRPRWEKNKSYFSGQHFRGPNISGNDASWGTPIKDIIYKTSRSYTSSSNFVNDMNAKSHFFPASNSGKGVEGGQLALRDPDNVDLCIDAYKDVSDWFGRGMRSYIRLHDNTASGYQILLDPKAGGGAWLAHSPDLKHGDSSKLIPWGGEGSAVAMIHCTGCRSELVASTANAGAGNWHNWIRVYDLNNITTENTAFIVDRTIQKFGTFTPDAGPIVVHVSYAHHNLGTKGGAIDQCLAFVAQYNDVNNDPTKVVISASNSPNTSSGALAAYINLTAIQYRA